MKNTFNILALAGMLCIMASSCGHSSKKVPGGDTTVSAVKADINKIDTSKDQKGIDNGNVGGTDLKTDSTKNTPATK